MRLLRRAGRWLLNAWAMGGVATMGGPRNTATGHPLQTRFLADSVLSTVRDEDEQDERARTIWSVLGALALAALGVLAISASLTLEVPFALFLGTGQLVVAGAVLRIVVKRATRSSGVHAAGIVLAAVSILVTIFAPDSVLEEWALVTLLLGVAVVVGLAIGRR